MIIGASEAAARPKVNEAPMPVPRICVGNRRERWVVLSEAEEARPN
jgi:hypothetical protein